MPMKYKKQIRNLYLLFPEERCTAGLAVHRGETEDPTQAAQARKLPLLAHRLQLAVS